MDHDIPPKEPYNDFQVEPPPPIQCYSPSIGFLPDLQPVDFGVVYLLEFLRGGEEFYCDVLLPHSSQFLNMEIMDPPDVVPWGENPMVNMVSCSMVGFQDQPKFIMK